MKLTGIAAAAALMLPAAVAPAYAVCPGGADTPPLCVTGLPTWLGSGPNCERYEVAGLPYAIVYSSTTAPGVIAGLRDGMGKGISVSVQTLGTKSEVCKDGSYYIISSVRNALN